MKVAGAALTLAIYLAISFSVQAQLETHPRASVLKVVAATLSGRQAYGSAVVVESGKLVTNCHVLRGAHSIQVVQESRHWAATRGAGNTDHDLCIIDAPGVDAPAARVGTAAKLKAGARVFAVGYPAGGDLVVSRGRVESLYQFEGGEVIRTSAAFDPGASGGALFSAAGELVGILTFKAPSGGAFHFAMPADWISTLHLPATPVGSPSEERAFWERDPSERPMFLRAAWLASKAQWPALFEICERWSRSSPDSREATFEMVKAVDRLLGLSGADDSDTSPLAVLSSGKPEDAAQGPLPTVVFK